MKASEHSVEEILQSRMDMDDLRRAVAKALGQDEDLWPEHGNPAVAIACVVEGFVRGELSHLIRGKVACEP